MEITLQNVPDSENRCISIFQNMKGEAHGFAVGSFGGQVLIHNFNTPFPNLVIFTFLNYNPSLMSIVFNFSLIFRWFSYRTKKLYFFLLLCFHRTTFKSNVIHRPPWMLLNFTRNMERWPLLALMEHSLFGIKTSAKTWRRRSRCSNRSRRVPLVTMAWFSPTRLATTGSKLSTWTTLNKRRVTSFCALALR